MPRPYRKRRFNYAEVFEKSFAFATDQAFSKFLNHISKRLKEVIKNQEYNWQPLSPKYAEWKKRMGLDPRTLVSKGDYVDAIGVYEKPEGKYVGFKPGEKHRSLNWDGTYFYLDYVKLARILEFGNRKVPARPHWRPVASEAKQMFNQTSKELAKELRDRASQIFIGIKRKRLR